MQNIKELMAAVNLPGLKELLAENRQLANEGIPYDDKNTTKAHPLHRICDAVFSGIYSDEEAVEIASVFIKYGANINGYELIEGKDTPLLAAASLHAEKTGILYIENGADIHHRGCSGGTALHWAAWVGRDKLVKKLIEQKARINQRCIEFTGTPLLWAVHGYKFAGEKNRYHQVECIRLLLDAGADKTIPNKEGSLPFNLLDDGDTELIKLLK